MRHFFLSGEAERRDWWDKCKHCTVYSDGSKGDFSHVKGILHVSGHAPLRSHLSLDMDCLGPLHIQRRAWGYSPLPEHSCYPQNILNAI